MSKVSEISRIKKPTPAKPKDKVQYFLKCPSEKSRQRTFSIVRKLIKANGSVEYTMVDDSSLKSINTKLLNNQEKKAQVRKVCKSIVKRLYEYELQRRGKLVSNADNKKILELYLDKKYRKGKRKTINFAAVQNEVTRCLRLLGNESLTTITQERLQGCVNTLESRKQKRYVVRLRSILKITGIRGIKINFSRAKKNVVKSKRKTVKR